MVSKSEGPRIFRQLSFFQSSCEDDWGRIPSYYVDLMVQGEGEATDSGDLTVEQNASLATLLENYSAVFSRTIELPPGEQYIFLEYLKRQALIP